MGCMTTVLNACLIFPTYSETGQRTDAPAQAQGHPLRHAYLSVVQIPLYRVCLGRLLCTGTRTGMHPMRLAHCRKGARGRGQAFSVHSLRRRQPPLSVSSVHTPAVRLPRGYQARAVTAGSRRARRLAWAAMNAPPSTRLRAQYKTAPWTLPLWKHVLYMKKTNYN